jgi:hypothetical protein
MRLSPTATPDQVRGRLLPREEREEREERERERSIASLDMIRTSETLRQLIGFSDQAIFIRILTSVIASPHGGAAAA